MTKKFFTLVISTTLIAFTGCNKCAEMKSYNVGDYKIIEIRYGDEINPVLIDLLEETDPDIIGLIDEEEYTVADYNSGLMCLAEAYTGEGGYRMLNNDNGKYLEVSVVPDGDSIYKYMGLYDGEKTHCRTVGYENEFPMKDDAFLAYELADIFMSETKTEITDERELQRYSDLLSEKWEKSSGEEFNLSTFLNIKFLDVGTTRLIRIHENYYDGEGDSEGIVYIQITLSNDVEKFEEEYDAIYEDTKESKESRED